MKPPFYQFDHWLYIWSILFFSYYISYYIDNTDWYKYMWLLLEMKRQRSQKREDFTSKHAVENAVEWYKKKTNKQCILIFGTLNFCLTTTSSYHLPFKYNFYFSSSESTLKVYQKTNWIKKKSVWRSIRVCVFSKITLWLILHMLLDNHYLKYWLKRKG